MAKKVLIVASVVSMIKSYNQENIKLLQKMGYDVDVACNFKATNFGGTEGFDKILQNRGVTTYQIDFARSPYDLYHMFIATKQLAKIIKHGHYHFVHCHSPIGGLIARLLCRFYNTKTIYTAHGFHFYDGAPIQNWLFYYTVEYLLSFITDSLITMNKEDYERAKNHFHARHIWQIPGIGLDIKEFADTETDREAKRREINVPSDAILIITASELIKRKNVDTAIKAIAKIDNPRLHYVVAGKGPLSDSLNQLIKSLGAESRIQLLGFRTDIAQLCKSSDIFLLPSFQEGLSVAVMEAMASGLPCITSRIRGSTDLMGNLCDECTFKPLDQEKLISIINNMINNPEMIKRVVEYNKKRVLNFSVENSMKATEAIYRVYDN